MLPYLEITKNSEEEQANIQVEMPELTGLTVKEAKQKLKELELEYEIDTDNNDAVITGQLPKKGIQVTKGTKIVLYSN